jgi:hypothetical protein
MAGAGRFNQTGTQTVAGKAPAKSACTRRATAQRIGGPLRDQAVKQGYRLAYVVEDDGLIVLVLSAGKRENSVAC